MDFTSVPLDNIDDFIQWLEELLPDKCPLEKDTERQVWIKVGKAQAAQMIIAKLNYMKNKGVTKNGKQIQPVQRSIRDRR